MGEACWCRTNGCAEEQRSFDRPVVLLAHRVAQLLQGSVDAALDGSELLSGELCDLGHGEVGAEGHRDRLALHAAQPRKATLQSLAISKAVELVVGQLVDLQLLAGDEAWAGGEELERSALAGPPADVIAEAIERDRI